MKKKINVIKTFKGTVDSVREEIKKGLSLRLQSLASLKFTDTATGMKVKGSGFDATITLTQCDDSVEAECTVSLGFLLRPFATKVEKELNSL